MKQHNPAIYRQFFENCSFALKKLDPSLQIRIMSDSCLENLQNTGRLTVVATVITLSTLNKLRDYFSDFSVSINLEKADENGRAECWIVLYSDTFPLFADCDVKDDEQPKV